MHSTMPATGCLWECVQSLINWLRHTERTAGSGYTMQRARPLHQGRMLRMRQAARQRRRVYIRQQRRWSRTWACGQCGQCGHLILHDCRSLGRQHQCLDKACDCDICKYDICKGHCPYPSGSSPANPPCPISPSPLPCTCCWFITMLAIM